MLHIDEVGTVGERILQLVDHFQQGNKTAFGRAADIQSGVLAGIVGGRESKPGFEILQKLLTAYPSINPNWLLFGRGEMLIAVKPMPTYEETHPHRPKPDGSVTVGGFSVSKEGWEHGKAEYEQRQQAQANHERMGAVLTALVDYMAKTHNSPEFLGIQQMLAVALNPPLTEEQEDALWAERLDAHHHQEEAEWARQRQVREDKQEGQQ